LATGAGALLLPQARACEYFTPLLRVTHPWARATAEGAGTAVVCMRFDEVSEADRLVSADTPVAEGAEIGGPRAVPRVDFAIAAGLVTEFDERGSHLRLLGLRQPLEVGRSYPLRLGFEKGGTVNALLSIDYARFS
jgi:copper(I)-binding protein